MKITLMGYGKMGREIEAIAIERGHKIVHRINSKNTANITDADLQESDVIIEFSTPHTAMDNIRRCLKAGVPVVVGTTGWHEKLEEVKHLCDQQKGALFYASNFSIGVNIFFHVNAHLARMMNRYSQYDVSMEEIHHIHKLDKPSGTAITLANGIINELDRKTRWSITEKDESTLHIQDVREGEVPGTHIIRYQSAVDTIEISHVAHNRKGFALGAVVAAEYLQGKIGCLTMDDLMKE